MKNISLRITLLVIAFFIAIAAAVLYLFVSELFFFSNFIIVFGVSFFGLLIFLFFIEWLIIKKINWLTETVDNYRLQGNSNFVAAKKSSNEIENLNHQIFAWAEERKNEIERLKKLEVYRKEFLGNVSHELKTPIFNIQGYILTLLDGGLEDQSINRNFLQRTEKSIDRMITIVDDLEAISQLETGELQLEPEKFDIVILVKDVIEAQEMKATSKGIILTVEEEKQIFVNADRFRIRQVIVNLVVNSIKYGKEYGETKIRFYDVGENVSIEIADNGIGIGEEHLPRLFERFYRVDKSRSRDIGGTGLGLAIVKHTIEAHNQSINVMSTEGVGTIFSFSLAKAV